MPPVVLAQPVNQTNFVHSSAVFAVTADGTSPLTYQWNFNGTNLPGATNASLTLTNLQYTQAGNYAVLVTNAFGAVTSSNAVLVVASHPPVALPDTVAFLVGTPQASFNVLSNDYDVDDDLLTVQSFTSPTRGVLAQINNGQFTYQPNPNFTNGQDQFTYTITDGHGGTANAQVTINVHNRYLDGGDWATFGNGPSHTGYYPGVLGGATFVAAWSTNFDSALNPVAVGGGNVYVTPVTYFGTTYLVALDAATGQSAWRHDFASAFSINPPTFDSDSVYVQRGDHASDTQLWRINAADGSVIWSASHAAQWERYYAPLVYGDGVWVDGGYYGGMYGFGTNGTQRFFNSTLAQFDQWTPTYYQGVVYSWVAGMFKAHDPMTGTNIWSLSLAWNWDGYSMNTVAAIDGGFAFVQQRPNLIAIDLAAHTNIWIATGGMTGSPAVAKGIVYAIFGNQVNAFAAQSGASLGGYQAANDTGLAAQPIITDDALLVASSSSTYVFDLASHQLIQTIPYGGTLSLANGRLYIAGQDGWLRVYSTPNVGPAVLTVVPSTGLAASGPVGGPFNPSNMVYTLGNSGTNALDWSAICLQAWVPVLTNTSPDAVRVIVINSPQNHRFFRAVASTGVVQPVLSAASYSAGQFQFTLSGQADATYIIEALTDLQAPEWVTVDPPGGSLAPGASTNVNVLINASACSLGSGVYTATVAFRNLTSGAVQGRPVSLTVQMLAPNIITQPTNQTVIVGGTANFNVTANGMLPLSYQWRFNGTNIVGATDTSLTLTNVQLNQAGNYTVLVTNASGSILSSNALLTVVSPGSCAPVPSGLVSWWPGEGDANDIVSTNNGVLQGAISFAAGEVGQAFVFDGSSTSVQVPASSSLNVGLGGGFTLETWIKPVDIYSHIVENLFEWNDGSGNIGVHVSVSVGAFGDLYANIIDTAGVYHAIDSAGGILATNVLQHLALTYDKTTGVAVLYLNGVAVTNKNLGSFTPQTSYDLYFGERPSGPFTGSYFNGLMDEISIYNRALSSDEVASIYNAGSGGKCVNLLPPVPVITGFSPASGLPGISVTISGTNFSPVLSNNIVYFGAVRAVVTAASVTNLVVTVPVGATYAPITETVGGLVAYARTAFEPTFLGDGSNISPSSFAPRVDLPGGSGSFLTVIADLDGDGKPDLVVANGYDNNISLFRNISTNGPLTINSFAPRVDLPSIGGGVGGLTVADVDGDGKLDLVVSDYSGNQILVYRNISTVGTLTADSFAAPVAFNVGNYPMAGRVRDLDGDGRPDIVCVNNGDNTISILKNIGTAGSLATNSFAPQVTLATGNSPHDLVIADLDGDGKPDLAQVNYTPSFLSVFRNVSVQGVIDTNSFAARVDFAAAGEGDSIIAGDVDGDGKVDLVAGWAGGSAIAVYRNMASPGTLNTSSFAPEVDFPVPGWTRSVGLGDLNGDGKPDISLTCEVDSYMCVYQNLSTPGSFTNASLAARVDYGAGWNPHGVAIGDLDGDGRPDIIFGNTYDSTISIYQNVVPFGTNSALDHFAWNPIPSPRFVNTPFAVTIRAQNPTNGISTNFTGTAILGTTNGVAVTPSVSGNFVQGVWTGAVVIAQTASNLVLQANDGLGHFGLANPINVVSLPSLGMLHSGNIAVYMWPVGYPGFVLETSGSLLAPIAWTVVPYSPVQVGDQYLLPLHMTGTNGYYRLWFPGP
jgi:outer membrane protein assembly factor BamB